VQAAGEWVRARVPVSRVCRPQAERRAGWGAMGIGARRIMRLAVGEGRERGTRGEADAADRDGGGCAARWRAG